MRSIVNLSLLTKTLKVKKRYYVFRYFENLN